MNKYHGAYVYSPTSLVRFWQNEFCSWLDRYDMEFPDILPKDEVAEETELLFKKGMEHEKRVIEQFQLDELGVFDATGGKPEGIVDVLKQGHHRIYQATMALRPFYGIADLLLRVDTPSDLGNFSYEVADMKLSKHASPTHIIQLCCYAEMLESLQGVRPKHLHIILGTKDKVTFRTEDYYYYYLQLKEAFLAFHGGFDGDTVPELADWSSDFGRWTGHVETLLEEKDHLCRVANITKGQIKKLKQAGIHTLSDLANSSLDRVSKLDQTIFQRLKTQARLQLQSKTYGKPVFELVPFSKEGSKQRFGLSCLPPKSPLDVFFDMEGNPHYEGGLEYLFGATIMEEEKPAFKDWWAFSPEQEKKTFEDFIDWVYARWQADPTMHVYHYASYEVTAMRKLMGRYGTREKEVDDLLRNEVFIDLYRIVSQSLRVGEASYSIKKLERFYKEARTTEVKSGGASIVYFEQWLECPDGDCWQNSKILKEIRDYNEDDCVSTYQLTEWLRQIQQDAGIIYIPPDFALEDKEEDERPLSEKAQLAATMLAEIPADRSDDPEKWRLQELLAWLLEFHRREQKPYWWQYFTWLGMTDYELTDEFECLGLLTRTETPPVPEKRSMLYEYKYDPHQETKLRDGDDCKIVYDGQAFGPASLFSIAREKGLVQLKVSQQSLGKWEIQSMPDQISLIPGKLVNYDALIASIFETVEHWHNTGELKPALRDFLLRNRPCLKLSESGPVIPEGSTTLDGAVQAVLMMNNSTLCIQGPPGTGKSYTAAHMILALIQAGYRVGVTSNSHKAIINLLEKTAEEAKKQAITFQGVRLGPDKDERLVAYSQFDQKSGLKGIVINHYDLIGGTAWPFSDETMQDQLDYLFIDEAGQVCIANLVAMSRSTRNIVLMGDQMQLDQPTQGSHPGESGMSILEYYLQGKATIPEDLGIFLGVTWRLHPEICEFISETVYEGRLKSKEDKTSKQRLILPGEPCKWLKQEAGIVYLPVVHEGNQQSCEEEVEVIKELMQELQNCEYEDGTGRKKRLTLDDILIVSPYNLQVRYLKEALGDSARVASVDKFQGQEAPVVIVSMCTSDGNESLRGLDFLLSKNRLNVALSRAKGLAIVLGSPKLGITKTQRLDHIPLVNLYCRLIQQHGPTTPTIKSVSLTNA